MSKIYGNKRICRLCDKEVTVEEVSNGSTYFGCRAKRMRSDEAVLWNGCIWICNECWKKIMNEVRVSDYKQKRYWQKQKNNIDLVKQG